MLRTRSRGGQIPASAFGPSSGSLGYKSAQEMFFCFVRRGLFVDAGFYTHPLLNRPRPRYAYNTYFVGLILRLRGDR